MSKADTSARATPKSAATIAVIDASQAADRARFEAIRHALSDPARASGPSAESVAAGIFADVAARGDDAVAELTERHDGVQLSADAFRVPTDAIAKAADACDAALLDAMVVARDRLLTFQRHILREPPAIDADGVRLRLRHVPMGVAACLVPGASAPLVSSVIHTTACAKAAGVERILIFSPPRFEGSVHPTILAAASVMGIDEVYRIGGAQAVAATAIGTARIPRADIIVGPGNAYVTAAKKIAFGRVDIDSLAGPSEVIVLADASADPALLAADLIAQAEHDPGGAILITWCDELVEPLKQGLVEQLATLPRAEATAACLARFSAIVRVANVDEAIALTNAEAPEHLEIQTENAAAVAERCTTAGAVFVGPFTPEALGDYVAGPSHVLPTGGTARFFSGLSSLRFVRRQSVIEASAEGLQALADATQTLANAEGLVGHAESVRRRVER